jgi:hypothetical protein
MRKSEQSGKIEKSSSGYGMMQQITFSGAVVVSKATDKVGSNILDRDKNLLFHGLSVPYEKALCMSRKFYKRRQGGGSQPHFFQMGHMKSKAGESIRTRVFP